MMNKVFKKIAVVVAAAAMMISALPMTASAATKYEEGDYTVTANLVMPKAYNPVKLWDVYFTNTDVPPKSQVENNADLTVNADGSMLLTVPVENTNVSIRDLGTTTSTEVSVVNSLCETDNETCSNHAGTRYTSITFAISPSTVSQTLTYTYSGAEAHAKVVALQIGDTEVITQDRLLTAVGINLVISGLPVVTE